MRLTAEAVLAMEEERYSDLGPPVFARGHLRKYAALVGVPVEEILADYDSSSSRAAESTLIPPASAHTPVRSHRAPRLPWQVWLIAAAVIAAVLAGSWWLWRARGQAEDAVAVPAGPMPEETAPPVEYLPPEADTDGVSPAVPESGPDTGPEGGQDARTSSTLSDPAADATYGSLNLEFSGPCWLEVYDAAGRRLAFELAEPGTRLAFGGPAPWRLVLGNAPAVRVSLDGSAVAIPPALLVRNAALVSITDAGDVRAAAAVQDS